MMTRDQAIDAYRRAKALSESKSRQLRETILVPHFGGCLCRMHNCQVNYEAGYCETPANPLEHRRQYKLAKRYDYEQQRIWDTFGRLQNHFARYF